MKIYIGLIERGCVTDEYRENVYVGENRKLAIQKIKEVKERNLGELEIWENGERVRVIGIK